MYCTYDLMYDLITGTPSTPDAPIAEANGPLAHLTLRTVEAGVGTPPHSFAFTVLVYSFNSTDNSSKLEREIKGFESPEYKSGDTVQVRVEEVMQLEQFYQFAAQAVNMFGVSEVSKRSDPIFLTVSSKLQSVLLISVSVLYKYPTLFEKHLHCMCPFSLPSYSSRYQSSGDCAARRRAPSLMGIPPHWRVRDQPSRDLSQTRARQSI